jgi:predicted transcriptional regulator of viral defense system
LPLLYQKTLDRNVISLAELRKLETGILAARLGNHVKILLRRGYYGMIKRGLYYVIPAGKKPEDVAVDKLLIGAKAAADAVLAYRSALEFHGLSRSLQSEVVFLSGKNLPEFSFREVTFRRTAPPTRLNQQGNALLGVERTTHLSERISVTNRERTLVDAIHRPDLSGSLEDIIHAILACPSIDAKAARRYALALGYTTLLGKIGWLLEHYGQKAGIKPDHLEGLRKKLPSYVPSLGDPQEAVRFDRRWRIFVPERLMKEETLGV